MNKKRLVQDRPWVGVDFDGTLVTYSTKQWPKIGEPIRLMMERVRNWLRQGVQVKIVTARADDPGQCELLRQWTEEHFGEALPITNVKDYAMVELWDDRAIQVIKNTGVRADGQD